MATEDFTTYVEQDVGGFLSQIAARSTFTLLHRSEDNIYLYDDKGAAYFTDFIASFKLYITDIDDQVPLESVMLVAMANGFGDFKAVRDANHAVVGVATSSRVDPDKYRLSIWEAYNGSDYDQEGGVDLLKLTAYYIQLIKIGTQVYVNIFSSSDFTEPVDVIRMTLQADHSLRYILCPQSFDFAWSALDSSGYVEALELGAASPFITLPNIDLELPAGSNIDLEVVVEIV